MGDPILRRQSAGTGAGGQGPCGLLPVKKEKSVFLSAAGAWRRTGASAERSGHRLSVLGQSGHSTVADRVALMLLTATRSSLLSFGGEPGRVSAVCTGRASMVTIQLIADEGISLPDTGSVQQSGTAK
jgi:hypothetical protein